MPESKPLSEPAVRYEKSDVRIGGILAFGIGLVVIGLLVQGAAAWLFEYLKESENRRNPPLTQLQAAERPRLPRDLKKIPEPRLQESETLDLKKLHAREDALLTSYGWIDRDKKVVRIPIAEAMRLLADSQAAAARGIRVRLGKEAKK